MVNDSDDLRFMSSLRAFKRHVAYANANFDHMVGWRTSSIRRQDELLKGSAIAYVANLLKVPAIFVKAVTDVVDGGKPTAEEFLQNFAAVTAALDQAVTQVVDFVSGKSF